VNPAEKRKQVLQIIVLVVLLGGLAMSITFMLKTVGGSPSTAPAPATTAAAPAPAGGAAQPAAQPGTPEAETAVIASGQPPEFNPNVFRIYDLDPPKNPFVQEERWYTEELEESLPGYPELRDNNFFEEMGTNVPEMTELLGEDESWRSITMSKTEADQEFNIDSESADGMIKTRMTYYGEPGRQIDLNWDRSSGVPVSELADGSWAGMPDTVPGDMPNGDDLFNMPGGGLTVPGMGDVFNGSSYGQVLVCQGVSGQGSEASALVLFNDLPRIVQAGDSLPPQYVVDAVTANGVALRDIRDNETVWLPIGAQSLISAGTVGGVRAPASPAACPPTG